MDLAKICVEPRLRNHWQAIDLGFVMARRWWWTLFLSWLLPALCLWLLLTAIFPGSPMAVIFIVWWLKPVFDRLPLYFASRAMFAEVLPLGSLFRRWRDALRFQWLPWLLWRRLSPTRSLDMPVTLLEQLKGPARNRRLRVMHQTATSGGMWLTVTLFHIEQLLIFGFLAVAILFVPTEQQMGLFSALSDQPLWLSYCTSIAWLLAMALIAPFYTMAGFSLYISRRVQLEGWDIEIRFRHLLERYSAAREKLQRGLL